MVLILYGIKALMEKKTIDMKKGVYTAVCSSCEQLNYMHIDGEGGFDPSKCHSCKMGFLSIEEDRANNNYIAVVEEEEEEETEVTKEESKYTKKSKESTKNSTKESFKLKVEKG